MSVTAKFAGIDYNEVFGPRKFQEGGRILAGPSLSQGQSFSHCVLCLWVVSDSLRPRGMWPARLLCQWGFSRQEYWSGLLFPFPGDLQNPGIKPRSPALQADALPSDPPGKPHSHSAFRFIPLISKQYRHLPSSLTKTLSVILDPSFLSASCQQVDSTYNVSSTRPALYLPCSSLVWTRFLTTLSSPAWTTLWWPN